jgi:hypothetical protein
MGQSLACLFSQHHENFKSLTHRLSQQSQNLARKGGLCCILTFSESLRSETMRLINTQTGLLEDFTVREIPQYAILSHTWTGEEVNLQEYTSRDEETAREKVLKRGFAKIMKACELAAENNIGYVWVDT